MQIEAVNRVCTLISRQIRETYRQLTISFIVHHDGQITEALSIAAQDMLAHPAAETALHIMRKKRSSQESAILGTAVAREQIFFGLASRETALTLCTLNIDDFQNMKETRRHAYHLAWHAIDAFEYHNAPDNHDETQRRVVVRKRNAMDIAAANLRADAFSAIMCALQDDYDAIKKLAAMRGVNALSRRSGHMPEYYPFAIAMEAAEFAAMQIRCKNLPRKKIVAAAMQAAHELGKTFDDVLVRQWLSFSQPAQDMAWRGFEEEEILSAAIHTSQNTYVRAAGYMISEVTDIAPASIFEINDSYSAFSDDRFNDKLHEKLVGKIFEDVIAEGLKRNSSDPFFETAERQNHDLVEGRVVGWCASALQSAAHGFDSALANGTPPAVAALREFESEQQKTTWESLKNLGKKIIRKAREGETTTLSTLDDLAKDDYGASSIRRSVQMSLKSPSYQKRLDASSELHPRQQPKAEIAPMAVRKAPAAAPAVAASLPTLGKTRPAQQQRITTRPAEETDTGTDGARE